MVAKGEKRTDKSKHLTLREEKLPLRPLGPIAGDPGSSREVGCDVVMSISVIRFLTDLLPFNDVLQVLAAEEYWPVDLIFN